MWHSLYKKEATHQRGGSAEASVYTVSASKLKYLEKGEAAQSDAHTGRERSQLAALSRSHRYHRYTLPAKEAHEE